MAHTTDSSRAAQIDDYLGSVISLANAARAQLMPKALAALSPEEFNHLQQHVKELDAKAGSIMAVYFEYRSAGHSAEQRICPTCDAGDPTNIEPYHTTCPVA